MAKTLSDSLLFTLEELVPYDFEKFKFKLQNTSLEKEHSRIPRGQLQTARPVKLASLLVTHYGEEYAVRLTLQVLRGINQRLLAEELDRVISQGDRFMPSRLIVISEYLTQDGGGTDSSAVSCSSGENKQKSLKIVDGPRGDGAASLLCGQLEAGKGSQKKTQSKRREQKVLEGLDAQGKPWPKNAALLCRRSPTLGKPQGEKESLVSASLRRNASSAGRLQGLANGSLGRKEARKLEVDLPSGKKRPKSLELTISPGEKELPGSKALLTLQDTRSASPDLVATPREPRAGVAGTIVALEKGSKNLEHSTGLENGVFQNSPSSISLAGEEQFTAQGEERDPGEPGAPEASKQLVRGVLWETSGRPPDEAACSLCHAQEGDPAGGTCMHNSCSCPITSGDPETSGSHSTICLRCQASLAKGSPRDLSPQPLPQCQRHMKQVQLLFCEDDREPICLICRLSQEHRGHQVRPIEEAALEYKEQIQKQLEHLKELRKSGEEQRAQGDKNMANFLRQTETQKQRIRCQLEQLCRFLEQQEQLFVSWLGELGQTISQAREKYGARVSRDIALLDKLIGELEAKQGQPEWELVQDVGVTLHRAKMVTVPESWTTPPEVKEKIHLLYQKSEFLEKSMKNFSETLRSELETFNVPELIGAQAHAVNVTLDAETAHPNLIFSDDLKSVRLGSKWDRLPDRPERFNSCIIALGSPSFLSGRHYWEVEVGDKTAWVLGVCRAPTSRKGSMTLTPENGYWVVMMTKRNEYQVSTFPPTRLRMREPPRRVGIFLDYMAGGISFYNVTARSHIYTFTGFSFSGPLQPIFSPGTHDGGKNTGSLSICTVGSHGSH
ncbi:Pyrin [Tupaia chinensis]|uniref:Pyrin n=1 Tax=Tupaia chinensis TaxID=246437 RepID=L8YAN9_TUPCH|nr:Pyrin [Tupaia chinensis]